MVSKQGFFVFAFLFFFFTALVLCNWIAEYLHSFVFRTALVKAQWYSIRGQSCSASNTEHVDNSSQLIL